MLPLLPLLLACSDPVPEGPPRNVVLVTLDTVRADHLGAYGYEAARTPVLDRMAAEGVVFETAISVAPITLPTHSAIMTGQYPHHHGVRNNGSFQLSDEAETLAERFAASGYDTAAVVSSLVLDARFGLDQGFRVYDDDLHAGGAQKLFMFKEVPAGVSIDKAIALVEDQLEEPFFLWVHLFDAHADYEPPPPYDVMFLQQPYDGEIAYLDRELGRLRDAFRKGGLADRTTWMVAADHGDSLGEHGEQTHGIFIYRATTHVPWIVVDPALEPRRVPGVVSQVDLAPTLLDLVHLPALGTVDGVSLTGALRGGRVPSRPGVLIESLNPRLHFGWHELRALDAGDEKVIQAPRNEYYDLANDPDENLNAYDGNTRAAGLMERLAQGFAGDDVATLSVTRADRDTRQMLESLGYVTRIAQAEGELPDPKDVAHRWIDLQRCQALIRARRGAEAVPCLQAVLEEDPDNWAALMSLASSLVERGRTEEALEVAKRAVERNPTDPKGHQAMAVVHRARGELDLAVGALQRAGEVAPADPEPWIQLGDLLQAAGKGDPAVVAYGEALRRDEAAVEAYVGLGNTFHRAGRSEKALSYLEEAVKVDPSNLNAWFDLGVVRAQLGRTEEALAAYAEALRLDPRHAMTHNNMGSLLSRSGDREGAIRAYRAAAAADPEHVESRFNLATLLIDEDPAQAVQLLEKVVGMRPELVPARMNLALALRRTGRPEPAMAQYQALLAAQPEAPMVLLAMASLEVERHQEAEARRLVKRAVAAGGEAAEQAVKADPLLAGLGG